METPATAHNLRRKVPPLLPLNLQAVVFAAVGSSPVPLWSVSRSSLAPVSGSCLSGLVFGISARSGIVPQRRSWTGSREEAHLVEDHLQESAGPNDRCGPNKQRHIPRERALVRRSPPKMPLLLHTVSLTSSLQVSLVSCLLSLGSSPSSITVTSLGDQHRTLPKESRRGPKYVLNARLDFLFLLLCPSLDPLQQQNEILHQGVRAA